MHIGSMTVESVIDGEIRRTFEQLYTSAPAEQLARARAEYADPISGEIAMTIGSQVVRDGDRVVLFDAGLGPNPTGAFVGGTFRSALRARGLSPGDITDVVFTHLHADHIGWSTREGRPFFANATYHCDQRDWDHFMSEHYEIPPWELASTRPEQDAARVRLAPLADRIAFWEGDAEVLPGIRAIDAAGHTPGTDVFRLESDGSAGLLLGDVVHSVPELLHDWQFPVHADADAALRAIARVRSELVQEGIPCSAAHFTGMTWGCVRDDGDGPIWEPVSE